MKSSITLKSKLLLFVLSCILSFSSIAQTHSDRSPVKNTQVDQTAGAGLQTLPFRFINIKVHMQHGMNSIHWGVADEAETVSYMVERSADGINFVVAGTITPRNMTTDQYYEWNDGNAYPGTNWYRVRATDQDGIIYYSPIAMIHISTSASGIAVFPSVIKANGTFSLSLKDQPSGCYEVKMSNSNGSVQWKQPILHSAGTNNYQLNISQSTPLNPGIYIISVRNEKGNVQVFRMAVN